MNDTAVLLVDLRMRDRSEEHLESEFPGVSGFQRVKEIASIEGRLRGARPRLVIFLFDDPTREGLNALAEAKRGFPAIPILMLTEEHSEDLAVWASETGVRHYMRSPFSQKDLHECVDFFSGLQHHRERVRFMPRRVGSVLLRTASATLDDGRKRTAPALAFIQSNLSRKITLEEVAEYCTMSRFTFSHLFKKEQGVTFQAFVSRCRIRKAQQLLLTDNHIPVTEVAFSVGFLDLSHFDRKFRQYVGVSPSFYRQHSLPDSPRINCRDVTEKSPVTFSSIA